MSNLTLVTRVESIEYTPHYRTPLSGPTVSTEVFLRVGSVWQVPHPHLIQELDRSGGGTCHSCGVLAWSEAWVAEGFMGLNTLGWADDLYRRFMAEFEADREEFARMQERAKNVSVPRMALLADLDPSQPA